MKKITKLLSITLSCIMLVSCANTAATTGTTMTTGTTLATNNTTNTSQTTSLINGTYPGVAPPPEIYENFTVIDFETLKLHIEERSYDEPILEAAYDYYHKDGYIYKLTQNNFSPTNGIRMITPTSPYYDVGTWQRYRSDNAGSFAMGVFHVDETLIPNYAGNIYEYIDAKTEFTERFKYYEDYGEHAEVYLKTIVVNGKTAEALIHKISSDKDDKLHFDVYCFIDDTHYLWLNHSNSTEGDIIKIISEITFEKVALKTAE